MGFTIKSVNIKVTCSLDQLSKPQKMMSLSYWCSPRLIKVVYASWILLLWVSGLYLGVGIGNEDSRIRNLIISYIVPIVAITLLTFPFVLYMGGCVVSLPGACNPTYKPRTCCKKSTCN